MGNSLDTMLAFTLIGIVFVNPGPVKTGLFSKIRLLELLRTLHLANRKRPNTRVATANIDLLLDFALEDFVDIAAGIVCVPALVECIDAGPHGIMHADSNLFLQVFPTWKWRHSTRVFAGGAKISARCISDIRFSKDSEILPPTYSRSKSGHCSTEVEVSHLQLFCYTLCLKKRHLSASSSEEKEEELTILFTHLPGVDIRPLLDPHIVDNISKEHVPDIGPQLFRSTVVQYANLLAVHIGTILEDGIDGSVVNNALLDDGIVKLCIFSTDLVDFVRE